ncbi:unnamed protein product [Symbiodinium microadriaticum]|nr:unnamed protein product [Symbiodinium microadriaticum]
MLGKGDTIPNLKLKNHSRNEIHLHDYLGKGPIVLFFYPKNETPGCLAEACEFRDHFDDFLELGAQVVGISADTADSHERYRKKYGFLFQLLSDSEKKAEKAFRLKRNLFGLLPGRVTFVCDKNGVILDSFESATQVKKHARNALQIIKQEIKKDHDQVKNP